MLLWIQNVADEAAALEMFLSWPNRVFTMIWNVISERLSAMAAEPAIATKTVFLILGC